MGWAGAARERTDWITPIAIAVIIIVVAVAPVAAAWRIAVVDAGFDGLDEEITFREVRLVASQIMADAGLPFLARFGRVGGKLAALGLPRAGNGGPKRFGRFPS